MEAPKTGLIRIARSPEGKIGVDAGGKAPGRGAYICADLECVKLAKKKNALARALKHPVDPMIYLLIEEFALERDRPA
jgi:predicted RNA-binding protein YlxR (DUF448 family)